MKTQILKNPEEAALLLKQGEIVAFPTETVYGLGAPLFSESSIRKIFEVKKRPADNPLIVHISSLKEVEEICSHVPEEFYLLAKAFFPGPLTVLLPKSAKVPDSASASLPTIGIRMPDHALARTLIQLAGPLVAPSANLSGKPSSTKIDHVLEDFDGKIAAILEGGPSLYGLESTILTLHPKPLVLRPGAITKEQLSRVLDREVDYFLGSSDKPLAPGMKYRHYAPKCRVYLFDTEEQLQHYLNEKRPSRYLTLFSIKPEDLYHSFRLADHQGMEEVLIVPSVEMRRNLALMNRLEKAAWQQAELVL